MSSKITMEMSICQAEIGFFLDELVKKWQILMKRRLCRYFEDEFATYPRGLDVPDF